MTRRPFLFASMIKFLQRRYRYWFVAPPLPDWSGPEYDIRKIFLDNATKDRATKGCPGFFNIITKLDPDYHPYCPKPGDRIHDFFHGWGVVKENTEHRLYDSGYDTEFPPPPPPRIKICLDKFVVPLYRPRSRFYRWCRGLKRSLNSRFTFPHSPAKISLQSS